MPKDEQTRASLPGARSTSAGLPGTWQAVAVAALSALVFGYWARSGVNAPGAAAAANVSRVAEVAPQDVTAALDTMSGSHEQLAQFREREACSRRLAWVTIMRSPGQPPGRIRLQSGAYLSPAFDLTDAPVRVALPYPAPYATGHGMISVLGTTTDAIVALTPPWRVPAQEGLHAREVTWTPSGDCPGTNK
jgi:hypothetical protein